MVFAFYALFLHKSYPWGQAYPTGGLGLSKESTSARLVTCKERSDHTSILDWYFPHKQSEKLKNHPGQGLTKNLNK